MASRPEEIPEMPEPGADTPDHAIPVEEPGFEPEGGDPLPEGHRHPPATDAVTLSMAWATTSAAFTPACMTTCTCPTEGSQVRCPLLIEPPPSNRVAPVGHNRTSPPGGPAAQVRAKRGVRLAQISESCLFPLDLQNASESTIPRRFQICFEQAPRCKIPTAGA